jgi:hypothetical protein
VTDTVPACDDIDDAPPPATDPPPAAPRWQRLRPADAAEVAAALAFTLWIAWPFLAPGGYVTDYDTLTYSGPNLAATFRAWDEHRVPFWEPGVFGGTAFAANLQTAVFSPLKLLFWPLGAAAAMGALTATHLVVLAAGMWVLARRTLRLAPPAGLVAVVVMVGSGTTMVRSVRFEQIAVVAWLPWLLVAIDAVVTAAPGRRARPVGAAAVVTALVLLSGHPNQAMIGAALAAVWTVVRIRDRAPGSGGAGRAPESGEADRAPESGEAGRAPGSWRAALGRVAAAAGLGLGIAGLPLVLAAPLLRRIAVSPDVMLAEAAQDRYTLWPARLVSAFLGDPVSASGPGPLPTVETPVFVGAGALVLAIAGAAIWWTGRDDRATVAGLVAAAAACLVLALGPDAGVYRVAAILVPGFGNGRVPVRWLFITTFAVAVLAAAAVSALATRGLGTGRDRRVIGWAAAAGVTVVVVTALAPPYGGTAPAAAARVAWVVVVVGAAGLVAVVLRRGGPALRYGAVLVALVVVVELGLPARASYARSLRTDGSFADRATAVDRFLAERGGRALAVGGTTVNDNLTAGWRSLDGYDGGLWLTDSYVAAGDTLTDQPFRPLERLGDQVRRPLDADALARYGVRYVVIDPAVAAQDRLVPGWPGPLVTDGRRAVWENPRFRSEARLVAPAPGDPELPVTVHRPAPDAIDADLATGAPGGRLLVAEQALPGWTATVDGDPVALVDADGFRLAVDVPPGARTVRFRYEPPGLVAGSALSLSSLLATAGLVVCRRRQRPMRSDASSSSGSTGRSGTTTT